MANEEQLRMLLQGRNNWATWLNANRQLDRDLTGADLAGRDLSHYPLDSADLSRANLRGARLASASLQRAHLIEADLSKADLNGAILTEAKLASAKLDHANLANAKLERADFSKANLRKAQLMTANLTRAILVDANLEGATLASTNFDEAKLRGALLKGAEAVKAQFVEAEVSDTCLSGANLENADLSRAKGLVQSQLAGTILYHAVLDDRVADFKELERVAEVAQYGRKVFSILVLLCVFSWLVISQATDEALVTNSMVTALPLIQASVPLASLFYFMPVFVFVVFVYFHMNLQGLWTGLASLPAVFPDGEVLPRRAFPWIMTSLAYLHVPRLKDRRPTYWFWNVLITLVGAWFVSPITLLWFYGRYAIVGDSFGAYWLVFWFFAIVWFATDSYIVASKAFREAGAKSARLETSRFLWSGVARLLRPLAVALPVGFVCLWFPSTLQYFGNPERSATDDRIVDFVSRSPWTLDLRYAELSKVKPGFEKERGDDLHKVRPAQLAGRVFRRGDLTGAFLVGANLVGVDLENARLVEADLRKANLDRANLGQVKSVFVNLSGATTNHTDFREAILSGAKLTGIHGVKVDFRGAKLDRATLQGVVLHQSDFRQVWLVGANLRNAVLTLSNLEMARLDHADLTKANVSATNLHNARLQGTNLSGVILRENNRVTAAQIAEACGDEDTKLPPSLVAAGVRIKPCGSNNRDAEEPAVELAPAPK